MYKRQVGYWSVNDVGRVVNPMIVVGQLEGGAVQGMGQALCEAFVYDRETGQALSASFQDYAIPHADMIRHFEMTMDESTPCLNNAMGVKGVGELGTIGATAPFIGLFGTTWGILRAFQQIGLTKQAGLDVVGPGLAEALVAEGKLLCLPRMVDRMGSMEFRAWAPGDPLEDGPFGTRSPAADALLCHPDAIIAPLLAFDTRLMRLGQGFDDAVPGLRGSLSLQLVFTAGEPELAEIFATEAEIIPSELQRIRHALHTALGILGHDVNLPSQFAVVHL